MSSIDERVVKMKIDNSQFQSGVKSTSSLLEKLKQSLKLKGATDGIDKVSSAVSKFNMSGMQEAAISTGSKFSAMAAVAFSAIQKLTNAAIDCGQKIISSTTEGIREGFAEYEQYMGSIQTIMANTASKGTTLTQVNAALSELNTYADKTIYNFQEMTRNIGTFTAAGVDLKTSVSSIQGIANLAAVSGSTSQQASTAMYQLSQAIAAGTVKLMDWNSVVNAGMGGEVFQQALIRTSEHLKTGAKAAIEAKGSFRESLQTGWLTTQVLTDTLKQFALTVDTAEDYNNAIKDLVAQGYTQEEAKQIADMAKTAMDAATKVKTFSQLIDTLKEAVGSGWTTSWQLMIGDFEEAKDLWTGISDSLGKIINDSANARNALLGNLSTGYKQFVNEGIEDTAKFNESLTKVAKNHGVNIEKLINDTGSFEKACKQGWVTGDMLKESVNDMADSYNKMSDEERKNNDISSSTIDKTNKLAQALNDGSISADEFAKKFNRKSGRENIIEGLSSAFSSLWKVIQSVKGAWNDIFPPMAGETLYQYTVQFRNLMESIKPSSEQLDLIKRSFKGLFAILDIGKQAIFAVIGAIGKLAGNGAMGGFVNSILKGTASMGDFLVKIDETIKSSGIFVNVANGIATGIQIIIKIVQSVIDYFNDLGRSIRSSTDAFDVIGNKIESLKDKLKSVLSSSGDFTDKFSSIFGSVGDVITKVVTTITHGLGEAIKYIANNFSLGDIFAGLLGGGLFAMIQKMSKAVDQVKDVFEKINGIFEKPKEAAAEAVGLKDILKGVKDALSGFTQGLKVASIVAVAAAIGILVNSLRALSEIDIFDLGVAIAAMGAMMAMLNQSFKSLVKSANTIAKGKSMMKSAAALVIYAKAIQMLADAMVALKDLDIEQIAKGLGSIGVMMFALNKSMQGLDKKVSIKTSVSLIAMAKAIQMLVQPIQQLSTLSWEQIAKGLTAVGGALGEMAGAMKLLSFSKVGLKNSVAVIAMAKAMQMMAQPLIQLSNLSWEEIGHGLVAMGGALAEMGIVLAVLGKIGGFSSIFAAGSILMVVSGLGDIANALFKMGLMSWEQIGRGLAAMGGALAEIAIVLGALGKIAGFSSIFAAGAINIVTNGLYDISNALLKMGGMSWSEIGRGLTAMGGALGEIAIVTGALGKFGGLSSLIGGGAILLAVQSLGDIADALRQMGAMSWDEIGRGLTAMGGALGAAGLGSLMNSLSGFGAGAIATYAKPLGDLADSVDKWNGVSVPPNLESDLSALASGVGKFTFSGWGAENIPAVATGMSNLAPAISAWSGVSVPPNIGTSLSDLASGVGKFTLSGWGAENLSTVATGMSQLAPAMSKWNGISIPPNISTDLQNLASGVKSFTLSGWGAENLPAVATGMGQLAPAINKWNGVSVPPNIKSDLQNLSDGIKSFTLAFAGGWSLGQVTGPLGDLAGSVKKWNGVSVPPNIGTDLATMAKGVKNFAGSTDAANEMNTVGKSLAVFANGVGALSGIDFATNASNIVSFVNTLNTIPNVTTTIGEQLGTLAAQIQTACASINASLSTANIGGSFMQIATSVSASTGSINGSVNSLSSAFTTAANNVASSTSRINTSTQSNLNAACSTINGMVGSFKQAGSSLGNGLKNSFISKIRNLGSSSSNAMSQAVSSINSYYLAFHSTGVNLARGIANGLSDGSGIINRAAVSAAKQALDAANRTLGVHSPSREFFKTGRWSAIGLANGMNKYSDLVKTAGTDMAKNALDSANQAVMNADFMSGYSPIITPKIDISNIGSSIDTISSNYRMSVSSKMARNIMDVKSDQNILRQYQSDMIASNQTVTDAINSLRDDVNNIDLTKQPPTELYIDGRKLASTIAKPMDQALGLRQKRGI